MPFATDYFVSTPTPREVLQGLEQWGYYDQALSWTKAQLGDASPIKRRIKTEKASHLALIRSYFLPEDTFPIVSRAQGDLSGDGRIERVILRVVSGTMTAVDVAVNGECLVMTGKGGGGDWWIESRFEDGGKRLVVINGTIEPNGTHKTLEEIYSWDGTKFRLNSD